MAEINKEFLDLKLINHIYTPFSQLEKELEDRRSNKELLSNVENFLGNFLLEEFRNGQRSVISRNIVTPNFEFGYFMDVAKELSVKPLYFEYHDKLVSKNPAKYRLGKLFFFERSKQLHPMLTTRCIIDFNKYEGKNLRNIQTLWGEPLIEFHRKFFQSQYPELDLDIIDLTEWFDETRVMDEYYMYFFALFICHGVLFENYLLQDKHETEFFMRKIYPSFTKLERMFGVKPLIYPLLPIEHEKNYYWESYPKHLMPYVDEKLAYEIMNKNGL